VSVDEIAHTLNGYTVYFVYLAIADFVMTYITAVGFIYTGEHIAQKIRIEFLASTLR
jgi:ATP-binding cassette subfamily B (MDR/TAP) protein 1